MQTVFNQAQLELLDMMSFVKSPMMLSELRQVVSDYFAKQVQEEIDRLWENGTLDEAKVESFRHLHERMVETTKVNDSSRALGAIRAKEEAEAEYISKEELLAGIRSGLEDLKAGRKRSIDELIKELEEDAV